MKNYVLAMLLSSTSSLAMADDLNNPGKWIAGLGYLNLSGEIEDGEDISLGGVVASLGYKVGSEDGFYILPEVRLGVGGGGDSFSYLGTNVNVELDRFLAFSLRAQFDLESGMYLFATPTYANAKLSATVSNGFRSASVSNDQWDFGIGAGLGFQLSELILAEMMYENIDEIDIVSIGFKFNLSR